ncbi:MAG: NAD(P)H-hydrate dehydratase [Acidimicrobiales bacterium]
MVTTEQMRAIDAAAADSVEVLIGRAGSAVAHTARRMLGGTYGRRIVVVAGKGNNGADGRAAAALLEQWGARATVFAAADAPPSLPACDLMADAAYGTGLSGPYDAPTPPPGTPVLAVDIPSGYNGDTGQRQGRPQTATVTVTFAAPTPGLLFPPCRMGAGSIEVADIGLPVGESDIGWVTDDDIVTWVPRRPADHHKWRAAVAVIGGTSGMQGAARLASRAAMRSGAGYVRWLAIDGQPDPGSAVEVVGQHFDTASFRADADRYAAVVMGPGLGTSESAAAVLADVVAADAPLVLDADALTLAAGLDRSLINARSGPTVLTPHDGEFARLAGAPVGEDRLTAARSLAVEYRATVLLKGPTTVVADPDGRARLVTSGSQALATAGTGDVLAGVVGAFLARGATPLDAAAGAAHVHGRAGSAAGSTSMVAGDLPDRVGAVLTRWGLI